MFATHTTSGMELFLPPMVRFHEIPQTSAATSVNFAPALSFHQQATAQQAIDALRQMKSDVTNVYYLFVTDAQERLVGVVSLYELLCAEPGVRLFEFMDRRKIALPHNATLEEQAHLMSDSGLLALPVVDEQGRLIGAMDAGDMIRSVVQESTAEIHHLAGLDRDETLQQTTATTAYRSFWLLSSLLVAFLLAWLISGFTQVIASVVLLAALLPLAMRPGGQAGVQTLTFVTRALTLGKIGACDIRRVIGRELLLALLNGLIIGGLASLGGWLWQGQAVAGLVIGVAVFAHLVLAALIGAGVPLVCRAMNIDPTRVSSMVVSAATDACGIALMLSIATLALQMGYL